MVDDDVTLGDFARSKRSRTSSGDRLLSEEGTARSSKERHAVTKIKASKLAQQSGAGPQTVHLQRGERPPSRSKGKGKVGETSQAQSQRTKIGLQRPRNPVKGGSASQHVMKSVDYKAFPKRVKAAREKSPWDESQAPSADKRFHTAFQSDFYESVLIQMKECIHDARWIDFPKLRRLRDPHLQEALDACEAKDIKKLMELKQDWNKEIIMQFYATVYFDHDDEMTLHWMTLGKWYSVTFEEFGHILGYNVGDGRKERIHIVDQYKPLSTDQIGFMYTLTKYKLGTIEGLFPFFAYLRRLFRFTICTKKGDGNKVQGMITNLLARMEDGEPPFCVIHFIWEEIRLTSIDSGRACPYAPYIMKVIETVTNMDFEKDVKHMSYTVHLIKDPSNEKRRGRNAPPIHMAPPPSSAAPSDAREKRSKSPPIFDMLKAIFTCCKRISVKQDKYRVRQRKMEERQKQIFTHLDLQPPCSPLAPPSDEDDVFEDPFMAYELAQRAAQGNVGPSTSRSRSAAHKEIESEEETEVESEGGAEQGDDGSTESNASSSGEEEGSEEE